MKNVKKLYIRTIDGDFIFETGTVNGISTLISDCWIDSIMIHIKIFIKGTVYDNLESISIYLNKITSMDFEFIMEEKEEHDV